eukprot:384187_1
MSTNDNKNVKRLQKLLQQLSRNYSSNKISPCNNEILFDNKLRQYPLGKDLNTYNPQVPAFLTKYPDDINEIILVIFGIQIMNNTHAASYHQLLKETLDNKVYGPLYWDAATFTDVKNVSNYIYFGYFKDTYSFSKCMKDSKYSKWISLSERLNDKNGYYEEIFFIPIQNTETIHGSQYKNRNIKGISNIASEFIEDKRHGYWGSARDRMNGSAFNSFNGNINDKLNEEIEFETRGKRFTISVPQNMNIIRSGQDITKSTISDQNVYKNKMEPTLLSGMKYLQNNPIKTNCVNLRFINDVNKMTGEIINGSTAGFGYFVNFKNLEKWSKTHKTHLKIFGGLGKLMRDGHLFTLYLWHEVFVVAHGYANYINVHNKTGLLRWYGKEKDAQNYSEP